MFTGIIEAIGKISAITPKNGDYQLQVNAGKMDLSDVRLGDSIAVNGVCLTVVKLTSTGFQVDVSNETVRHTAFKQLQSGSPVNLERALTLATRLGGHMVSGHVDGLGTIRVRQDESRSVKFQIEADPSLAKYIAHKGSITVDGTSLTVNAVNDNLFDLNIVPHTLVETIMASYQPGTQVNLEVDLIARYLERLILSGTEDQQNNTRAGIDLSKLAQYGFLR